MNPKMIDFLTLEMEMELVGFYMSPTAIHPPSQTPLPTTTTNNPYVVQPKELTQTFSNLRKN